MENAVVFQSNIKCFGSGKFLVYNFDGTMCQIFVSSLMLPTKNLDEKTLFYTIMPTVKTFSEKGKVLYLYF